MAIVLTRLWPYPLWLSYSLWLSPLCLGLLQAAIWFFLNEVLKGCAVRHEEWIGEGGETVHECGLYPELPTWWFLPLAGALCGYATNWIAMWLIFKPIEPTTYLGCVTLHGSFLKRQSQACTYHGYTCYGVPTVPRRSTNCVHSPCHVLAMHSPCTHHALTMHSPCAHHALTMRSLTTHLLVAGLRGVRDHLRREIAHGSELLGADPFRSAQPPSREDRRAPGEAPAVFLLAMARRPTRYGHTYHGSTYHMALLTIWLYSPCLHLPWLHLVRLSYGGR